MSKCKEAVGAATELLYFSFANTLWYLSTSTLSWARFKYGGIGIEPIFKQILSIGCENSILRKLISLVGKIFISSGYLSVNSFWWAIFLLRPLVKQFAVYLLIFSNIKISILPPVFFISSRRAWKTFVSFKINKSSFLILFSTSEKILISKSFLFTVSNLESERFSNGNFAISFSGSS